ncbi:MAG TPA: arginine N-succinyltransferase [Polyangia bacterium]|jgi:arginine N-succinyltransferase
MLLIRDVTADDLDGLLEVAAYLDSVNLPNDRARLRAIIAGSEQSFAGRCDVADRHFVFVLVDEDSGRLVGSSMIFAQHGSRRAPHVFFDVLDEERYSQTLDRHVTHRVLRIGYNYKGLTEIGGLVVRPEWRGHPAQLGKLLFHVRFLYIALHRAMFRDDVLSELMPPLEADGTSLLWEALGRKFTGLSYQEADRLSHENKEFIRALFPEEPIYATLLPPEVQAVIGEVGPDTRGVEKMLRRAGFSYAHRIDPFDGGPHFHARIDDVASVRAVRTLKIVEAGEPATAPERLLIAVEGDDDTGARPLFRAAVAMGIVTADTVALSAQARHALGAAVGRTVGVLSLDRLAESGPAR